MIEEGRKFSWRNFVQLGLILEYCGKNSASMYWYGTPSLGFNKKKKSYWMKSALDVFVGDWVAFIKSFPNLFSATEMRSVIRSHATNTGIFGLKSLLFFRANDGLNFPIINKNKKYYSIASPNSVKVAYAVALIPLPLIRLLYRIFYFSRSVFKLS